MVGIVIESAKAGNSEKNYILRLLQYWFDVKGDNIRFYKMSGKGEMLKENHPNYKTIEQENLDRILFIIDADNEYDKTRIEIKNLIKKLEHKIDSKMDYFISCNPDTKKGSIEDLLLSAVEENLKKCYLAFEECIKNKDLEYNKKVFLSKMFELKNPPYDINHKNFQELKHKLKWLIGE